MSHNFTYTTWSSAAEEFKPKAMQVSPFRQFDQGSMTPPELSERGEVNDCNTSDTSVPAWETDPSSWDYEDAKKLAEKLLLLDEPKGLEVSYEYAGELLSNEPSNPRFKTEFCRNFREKGTCVYGDQCQFAHGKVELRPDVVRHSKYKTKLCQKYWIAGYCAYGPRCNFIHKEGEVPETKPSPIGGLKPFPCNIRKQSESSNDSGIDSGFSVPPPTMHHHRTICPPSKIDRITYTDKMKTSPQSRNMMDFNSNIQGGHYKGVDSVPHPEHNPIPAGLQMKEIDVYPRFGGGIWSVNF